MRLVAIIPDSIVVESTHNNCQNSIRKVVWHSLQNKTRRVREGGGFIQVSEARMWKDQDVSF